MQQLHGSGKTAVLVERIINKIIYEKIDIDRLLVVTFTNAAASEMREKILNQIYKILDDTENKYDEQILNHLQRQITLLNKANICTIDSFCLDVIKNNFFEIEISPNFRIADTAEIELLKKETLEKLFEEKYENNDTDFEKLIKTYTSYRDDTPLKELILKIYSYINSNPFPMKWLDEQVEKFNISNENSDFSETEWGKILLDDMKEEIEDDIKKLKAEKRKLSVEPELIQYENTLNSDIEQLETIYGNLDKWDKACILANDIDFLKWPISRKIQKEEKERAKNIRDKVKKSFISKRDKIFISNSKETNSDLKNMYETLTKLKNLIIEFDKELQNNKQEKNIVDFTDIEHFALKILVKSENGKIIDTEIAKKYQEKFIEIAIDEYQDSNLVQEYILTSVSRKNNIFMVGDVKQSIYKFRQAMPDLFLDKYENYGEETSNEKGLKIKLFKNFRSRKNILDFTNFIFQNIMGKTLGEIDYTEEEYLNLGANYKNTNQNLITEIDILNISKQEDTEKNTEAKEQEEAEEENIDEETEKVEDIELEAKYVAKKIRDLIDSKFQIYDNKIEKFRDIKYKDIVILLRYGKNKANIFEKELLKQNINVYSDISSEYLESYEIRVIINLLKIIDNPYQDIPLVHVMLSSIGMFTNDELLEIRLSDQYDDFYSALLKSRLMVRSDLREKIQRFLDKLEDFREKNNYMDLDELIWTIYEETGFLNYVGLMQNGTLRVTNLRMLFERAKQYETASFKGLFNFINFIENVKSGNSDLGAAKLIGEHEDVVRIMSIHKSKGLEFPIVFLSNTGFSFNLSDLKDNILLHQNLGIGVKYIDYEKQIKYDTLTKLALREKILKENLSEEMRILYVALTRAKEKLYITAVQKDYDKKQKSIQEMVDIYNLENNKINPILLKKYTTYIDWISLVYLYNKEESKKIMELNVIPKENILKELKIEKKEDIDIFKFLEENSKEVTEEQILNLKNELEFTYKYKELATIPSKTSVTNIVHKTINVAGEKIKKENQTQKPNTEIDEEKMIEFPKPKFLKNEEDEKLTSAEKGTLIHICMKNLKIGKDYDLKDIENLIDDLVLRKIITTKEKETINPNLIWNFTKSEIWEELKQAKEYYQEEPFYINIPAKDVMDVKAEDNILVQGIIDLYYINNKDELILLDYKTDYIKQGQEDILINRHKDQLNLYKEALENALNKKVYKTYIYSTSLSKAIEVK